ncbi:hypothetical protein TNCV_1059821 [Trichonephila clavipes]|nr:hypothetical protein TNCV_1059821 [Trichonephila clavipes]
MSDTLIRKTFKYLQSEVSNKSGSEITPRQEFRLLCGNTVTGPLRNDSKKKGLVCKADVVSITDPRNAIMKGGEFLLIFRGPVYRACPRVSNQSCGGKVLQCRTPSRQCWNYKTGGIIHH